MHLLRRTKSKKVKGILRELFILTLSFSAVFGLENRASDFFFYLFCSLDERLLPEFLQNLGWFQGYNKRFPKYLG